MRSGPVRERPDHVRKCNGEVVCCFHFLGDRCCFDRSASRLRLPAVILGLDTRLAAAWDSHLSMIRECFTHELSVTPVWVEPGSGVREAHYGGTLFTGFVCRQ